MLGLSLSAYNIFLLPLDVALQKSSMYSPQFSLMEVVTVSFSLATVIVCLLIVPVTIFWYEGADDLDDPTGKWKVVPLTRIKYVAKYLLPLYLIVGISFGVITWQFAFANVPIDSITTQGFIPIQEYSAQSLNLYCAGSNGTLKNVNISYYHFFLTFSLVSNNGSDYS